MPVAIEKLIDRIRDLEEQLEAEFAERRSTLRYHIRRRRVIFEEGVALRHRELRIRLFAYVREARLLVVLTAPVIYSLIIPFVLLDLFASVYQAICFPVYGINKVRRSEYVIFDRHSLAYLNVLERLNCVYCSYGNGVIAYVREIASRTEQYWCPIKHSRRISGGHERYPDFADFGDAENYRPQLEHLRKKLRDETGE